jgi:hypothetical protein
MYLRRKILITDKCIMTLKKSYDGGTRICHKWRDRYKGESLRASRNYVARQLGGRLGTSLRVTAAAASDSESAIQPELRTALFKFKLSFMRGLRSDRVTCYS